MVFLGASHLVLHLSLRCSHLGLPAARQPSLLSFCLQISSLAASVLLLALLIWPRPPPGLDS